MPQRKQIAWAQLRVGALVLTSLVILAIGIFFISGTVGFLSRKYTLRTYLSGAAGLREGSQVRVSGIPVGVVQRLRITPDPNPNRAVEITMRVPRRYQNNIRADSEARMETAGLLGEAYVDVSRGSPGVPVLQNNGEVKSHEEADIKRIVQNANDVISNLRVLSAKLNDITNQVTSGRGSIGKLLYDEALYTRLNQATSSAEKIVNSVERGQGTLGKLLSDETLYQHAVATIDHVNQLMDNIQHGNGSLARLLSDPEVYNNLNQLVSQTRQLIDDINQGRGTLGKLATDPQVYDRLNETLDRLSTITERIDKGEGTLGKLSTDPRLFNSLNTSAQSLSEFLAEFKKNPRKYLTLHVRIF